MITLEDPTVLSVMSGVDTEDLPLINFKKDRVTLPLFQIWHGGSKGYENDPEATVELDYESKKYVRVWVNNIRKRYQNKQPIDEDINNRYELVLCDASLYVTPFEKEYYETQIKGQFIYCFDHPEIFLNGTKNQAVSRDDHSFLIYEIERCSEKNRNTEIDVSTCTKKPG